MEPIFGDPVAAQSLGMPSSWSVDIAQPVPATEQLGRLRTRATDFDRCVKSKVDRSFIGAKEFDMKRAVGKLGFFLHLDLESSGVGRQISSCPHETNETIRAVVEHHNEAYECHPQLLQVAQDKHVTPSRKDSYGNTLGQRGMMVRLLPSRRRWYKLSDLLGSFCNWMVRSSALPVVRFLVKQKFSWQGNERPGKLVHLRSMRFW